MQHRRVSADGHIDLNWLPHDLFVTRADARLRDRMPHVVPGPDGPMWITDKGTNFGLSKGVGPSGRKYVKGREKRADSMEEAGVFSDGEKGIPRVADPHMRLKDMERDGVHAEVIYGILGVGSRMNDAEAAAEMMRVYNDWIREFCSHYPERQIGLAAIPNHDVDLAVAEIRRAAKMGIRGLDFTVSHDMDSMAHPKWEPLWQAVAEVDLPMHFHTAPHVPWDFRTKFPGLASVAYTYQITCVFQMTLGNVISAIIGSGVLERYPTLRIVYGECGTGWLPYLLERMDVLYKDVYNSLPIRLLPSEYWRRQCRATFQVDRIGAKLVKEIGAESLMWGSDFPHLDGIWPKSDEFIRDQFAHLDQDTVNLITGGNAATFYRLAL